MPQLDPKPGEIQEYLGVLEATPRFLAACAQSNNAARLVRKTKEQPWSATYILGHLRACNEVWSHTIYAMLTEDNPSLARHHPREWMKATHYELLDFGASLQTFTLQRAELLGVLRKLPAAAWSRRATIGVNTHSIFSQARRLAIHESQHCEQVKLILK